MISQTIVSSFILRIFWGQPIKFCNFDLVSTYWYNSRLCNKVRSNKEIWVERQFTGFFFFRSFIYCISLNPRQFAHLLSNGMAAVLNTLPTLSPRWFFRPWCYIAHGSQGLLLWYNLIKDRCMKLSYTRLNWRIF